MGNSASGGGGGGSKGGKKGAKGGSSSQSQSASYRFKTIQDKYRSIDQVQAALRFVARTAVSCARFQPHAHCPRLTILAGTHTYSVLPIVFREAGLESSNLILGVDCTKSTWSALPLSLV